MEAEKVVKKIDEEKKIGERKIGDKKNWQQRKLVTEKFVDTT